MRLSSIIPVLALTFAIGCASQKDKPKPQAPPAPAKSDAKSSAASATQPSVNLLLCQRGQEVRKLRIEMVEPMGCKLWYSHYSQSRPVATSQYGREHCEKVRSKIQKNLEKASYTCSKETTNVTNLDELPKEKKEKRVSENNQ